MRGRRDAQDRGPVIFAVALASFAVGYLTAVIVGALRDADRAP